MRLPIRCFSALLHTHQLPSLALSLTHAALAVRGNHHPSADARSRTDSVVTVSTYPVVVSSLPPSPPTTLAPRFLEGTPDCLAFQSLPSSTQASRRWLIILCNPAPAHHGDSRTACDNDLFPPDAPPIARRKCPCSSEKQSAAQSNERHLSKYRHGYPNARLLIQPPVPRSRCCATRCVIRWTSCMSTSRIFMASWSQH